MITHVDPDAGARFPVMLNWKERRHWPDCPTAIPWALIAPFEAQAQSNHHQSIEGLVRYGGLHPIGLWALMHRQSWTGVTDPCTMSEAVSFLKGLESTAADTVSAAASLTVGPV